MASCRRSFSPVVTMCVVAFWYSQRVSRFFGTGAEMWRVRTSGGGRSSNNDANATSHVSVELCVLTTSADVALSHRRSAKTPCKRLRPMGSATTGILRCCASTRIRASGGHKSVTRCPRRSIPSASVRMRISCPPQPHEASVWTICIFSYPVLTKLLSTRTFHSRAAATIAWARCS